MTKIKTIFSGWLLISCGIINLKAQSGIVATGGEASGTGGKMSYSAGQLNYITATGSGGTTNQGIQQPYEIFVTSGIEAANINLSASVFPNPALDFINLSLENAEMKGMSYTLIDVMGKIITQHKLNNRQTSISMKELDSGIYFIKVLNNNREVKIFKIIKNR